MALKICRDAINTLEAFRLCDVKSDNICFGCCKSKTQLSLILNSHYITASNKIY